MGLTKGLSDVISIDTINMFGENTFMMYKIKTIEDQFIKSLKFSQKRMIGIEVELIGIKKNGRALDWDQIQSVFRDFIDKDWEPVRDGKKGPIVGVKNKKKKNNWYDYILTDTGYCLIEIITAPQENLHLVHNRYEEIKRKLANIGKKYDVYFLAYGIQPLTSPSFKLLTPRRRYAFFRKISNPHPYQAGTTIIASGQSNINLRDKNEAIRAFNVLSSTVPIQTALFANSPIWKGKIHPKYKVIRSVFWRGKYDPWRVGMSPRPFRNLEDYFRHIWSLETFLVIRDGKYYEVLKRPQFMFYLEYGGKGKLAEGKSQKIINLKPERSDIDLHNTFVWWDSRLKTTPKTVYIENRDCATQPPREQMTVFAFHLGLVENLAEAEKVLAKYSYPDLRNVRYEALTKALKAKIGQEPITVLTGKLLDVAKKGLIHRKLKEEKYLEPLYERIEKKESPADKMIKIFKKGGINSLIRYNRVDLNLD